MPIVTIDNVESFTCQSGAGVSRLVLTTKASPPPETGPQWYVDNAVSSSGDGRSWSSAWKSFSNIVWSQILPGSTLNISGGQNGKTYVGGMRIFSSGVLVRAAVDSGHSGPVTIFNNASNTQAGFFLQNVSDVTIRGFTVTTPTLLNQQTDGFYIQTFGTENNTANITIDRCRVIISNGHPDQHNDCIQTSHKITNLTVSNSYFEQDNTKSSGNAQGLWLNGCNGTFKIFNNIIYLPNSSNVLINIDPDSEGSAHVNSVTAYILNNTLVGGAWGNIAIANSPDSIIKNNIIMGTRNNTTVMRLKSGDPLAANINYNLYFAPDGNPLFFYHESVYKSYTTWRQQHGYDANSKNIDPMLVNVPGRDFHLQSNSPAIDAGVADANAPTTDYEGTPRPQRTAYDIGAYEKI